MVALASMIYLLCMLQLSQYQNKLGGFSVPVISIMHMMSLIVFFLPP